MKLFNPHQEKPNEVGIPVDSSLQKRKLGLKEMSNLPEVTQISRARIQNQALWIQSLCS